MNYQHQQHGYIITGTEYFKLSYNQREQFKQTEKPSTAEPLNCRVKPVIRMERKEDRIR